MPVHLSKKIALTSILVVLALAKGATAQPMTRWKAHQVSQAALENLNALNGAGIVEFGFNGAGGSIIVTADRRSAANNVPGAIADTVQHSLENGEQIRTIAFTQSSAGWCVVTDRQLRWGGDLPQGFVDKLKEFTIKGESVMTVAFAPNNGWIVVSDREWWETNLPQMALADIRDFIKDGVPTVVAFTANGGYVLASGRRYLARNIPDECFAEIERNSVDGFANDSIVFASNDSWAVVANRK